MITVTRLNHSQLVLNSDLIEQIETTPDTVISLTTGQRIMVRESSDEIVQKIMEFRRAILSAAPGSLVVRQLDSDDDDRSTSQGNWHGRR